MTWTALTYAFGSKLTSTKMTQNQDNFAAVCAKDTGAPVLANNYVVEAMINAGAVSQGKLKTTTGQVSTTAVKAILTLPGGEYGFYPRMDHGAGGNQAMYASILTGLDASTSAISLVGTAEYSISTLITLGVANAAMTVIANQRYVQSSPPFQPYHAGDDVPIFVFALLDKTTSRVISTYTAEDPPWGNNGPTIINPMGRLMALAKSRVPAAGTFAATMEAWADFDEWMDDANNAPLIAAEMARKFTQAEKNADMPLIPHPFPSHDPARHAVVVVNPCNDRVCRALRARHKYGGDSIAEALHAGHILIDNSPLPGLSSPPGVMCCAARWKLTP